MAKFRGTVMDFEDNILADCVTVFEGDYAAASALAMADAEAACREMGVNELFGLPLTIES